MKNGRVFFLALVFLLTACGTANVETSATPTPTATPNPGDIALQMIQQQMAAEATAQVVGLQFTATAQVIGQTSTAQAVGTQEAITQQARSDAQATAQQERKDAQATQARADAISTAEQARKDSEAATSQAFEFMLATQAANATSTFTVMTLTAIPPHATLTMMAVNDEILIAAQEVERKSLELQQARDTNRIAWAVPLLIALAVLAGGALWVWRESRWKVIKTDDGEVVGFGFDRRFVNPNLLPGAVLDFETGKVPLLTDAATQRDIIFNEQKIRAIAAIPSGAGQGFDLDFGKSQKEPPFEIVDVAPTDLLDDETMKVVESDWRKANE